METTLPKKAHLSRKTYSGFIRTLTKDQIIVYGSNPQGKHGRGVANLALRKFGAKTGVGRGLRGQSYGLVTKNMVPGYFEVEKEIHYPKSGQKSLSEDMITENIIELYQFARKNKNKEFLIAYKRNGKNLSGYSDQEFAKMFKKAGEDQGIPPNIVFEDGFWDLIRKIKVA